MRSMYIINREVVYHQCARIAYHHALRVLQRSPDSSVAGRRGRRSLQDFSFERNALLFLFRPNEIADWEMGMARYLYGRFAVCIRLILVCIRLILVDLRLILGGFGGDFSKNGWL